MCNFETCALLKEDFSLTAPLVLHSKDVNLNLCVILFLVRYQILKRIFSIKTFIIKDNLFLQINRDKYKEFKKIKAVELCKIHKSREKHIREIRKFPQLIT